MLFYWAASTFHGHSGSWCHRDHWLSALPVHTAGKKVVVPKDDTLEPGFKSLQMLLSYKRTKTNRNRSVSLNGNSLSDALCSLHLRSLCFKTPPVLWLWLVKEPLGIRDVDTVNTVQLGEKKHPFFFLFFFPTRLNDREHPHRVLIFSAPPSPKKSPTLDVPSYKDDWLHQVAATNTPTPARLF